jgi:thioester reductase-like protein
VFLPFVALQQLAEAAVGQGDVLIALKDVITAGEQLRITPAIAQWFHQLPNCTLHNHYGPSETHVVTAFTLTGSPDNWAVLPPIGYPITNAKIYLLNSDCQNVSLGDRGEIYIGGDCLARGYLNRSELTSERFILNPFAPQSGERLYKTGDLGRFLEDGSIEYLGRIDQQVKIRGFRIEPGEVESVLESHSKVQRAIVLAREVGRDTRLVAYILPVADSPALDDFALPFTRELRQFLRAYLPDYMIPSAMVMLDEFPLTPSGKVDRRALPTPKWTRMEEGVYVPPRTFTEAKLVQIWEELLGVESIGVHDNFFELGGHSLLAVRLIHRVSEAFSLTIPLEIFLESPTIDELANTIQLLEQGGTPNGAAQDPELDKTLDRSIQPKDILSIPVPNVFLTGTTGVLGVSLLQKLLVETLADVYCLVRATNIEEAKARIRTALKRYHLWEDSFVHRIIPVLGDLSKPKLGIESGQFDRLSQKIDIIYHCGAWVNMIYPYSAMKATNVLGTQEVLRLASQFRVKPVHFVSTIDVFSSSNAGKIIKVSEEHPIGPSANLYSGYAQSKYVAEQLLKIAHSRGVPISIYRPSNIMGDTKTGISHTSSIIALMLKGCIQMGMFPHMDALVNLVPVDYVSHGIIHLSQAHKSMGQAYHLINPQSIEWEQLINWVQQLGYSLQGVSYESWYIRLLQDIAQESTNVLAPLTPIFANQKFAQKLLGVFQFDSSSTSIELTRCCIPCPPIDQKLLETHLSSFANCGFLPSPISWRANTN